MDTEFELSNTDRFGALLLRKEQLAKPNGYYLKIHPTEASEVDARLAADKAKAEAKAKADAEAKANAVLAAKVASVPAPGAASPTPVVPAAVNPLPAAPPTH